MISPTDAKLLIQENADAQLSNLVKRRLKIRETLGRCTPAKQIKVLMELLKGKTFDESDNSLDDNQQDFCGKLYEFLNHYPANKEPKEQQHNDRIEKLEQCFNEKWLDIKAKLGKLFSDEFSISRFNDFFEKIEKNPLARQKELECQIASIDEEIAKLKPLESKQELKESKEFKEAAEKVKDSAGSAAGQRDSKTQLDNTKSAGLEITFPAGMVTGYNLQTNNTPMAGGLTVEQESLLKNLASFKTLLEKPISLNPQIQSELETIQLLLGKLQVPGSQNSKPA